LLSNSITNSINVRKVNESHLTETLSVLRLHLNFFSFIQYKVHILVETLAKQTNKYSHTFTLCLLYYIIIHHKTTGTLSE